MIGVLYLIYLILYRYKNDFRYVELWMALGKKHQDAGDLFKYLAVNGIGSNCALFYEEYAGYKETMGWYRNFHVLLMAS